MIKDNFAAAVYLTTFTVWQQQSFAVQLRVLHNLTEWRSSSVCALKQKTGFFALYIISNFHHSFSYNF